MSKIGMEACIIACWANLMIWAGLACGAAWQANAARFLSRHFGRQRRALQPLDGKPCFRVVSRVDFCPTIFAGVRSWEKRVALAWQAAPVVYRRNLRVANPPQAASLMPHTFPSTAQSALIVGRPPRSAADTPVGSPQCG